MNNDDGTDSRHLITSNLHLTISNKMESNNNTRHGNAVAQW